MIVFGAWLQTARAHDELRGSGGSLYYLSHRNVVEGSEQVRVEIRDKISRPPGQQHRAAHHRRLRGRLSRRPHHHARSARRRWRASPTLVRSANVDGDLAYLIVDYEYIVDGDSDDGTVGARATQKLGPVRLGGTVVNEFRAGGNYTLLGGDRADRSQEVRHHHRRVRAQLRRAHAPSRARDDGGLTYTDALGTSQATPTTRQGNAYKAEADLHLGRRRLHPYFARHRPGLHRHRARARTPASCNGAPTPRRTSGSSSCASHYDERRYQQALVYDAAGNADHAVGDAPRHRRRARPHLRHRRRARSARAPSAPTTPTTRARATAPPSPRASTSSSCRG